MDLNQDLLTKTGTLERLLLVTSPIKSVEDTKRRTFVSHNLEFALSSFILEYCSTFVDHK